MNQFKEKAAAQRELVSAGLFFYPLLQAADVLAYRTDEVPVGDDQRQHIELMREIARSFNARFGEILVVPEHRIPDVGARIMDLQNPESKMSTTAASEEGTVYVLDEPARIERKFRRAVTDSGEGVRRSPRQAGHHEPDRHPRRRPRRRARGDRGRVRERPLRRLQVGGRGRPSSTTWRRRASATRSCAPTRPALEAVLRDGAERARAIASVTLADVRAAMGVGPPAARRRRRGSVPAVRSPTSISTSTSSAGRSTCC